MVIQVTVMERFIQNTYNDKIQDNNGNNEQINTTKNNFIEFNIQLHVLILVT